MVITEMFFWWYKDGWHVFIANVKNWIKSLADFFSMSSLIRTLFKPYRQISANTSASSSSLSLRFSAFLDRLVSRLVGFTSRLILLLAGTILIILGGSLSLVLIILWPLIPLAPIAGLVLSFAGVLL